MDYHEKETLIKWKSWAIATTAGLVLSLVLFPIALFTGPPHGMDENAIRLLHGPDATGKWVEAYEVTSGTGLVARYAYRDGEWVPMEPVVEPQTQPEGGE